MNNPKNDINTTRKIIQTTTNKNYLKFTFHTLDNYNKHIQATPINLFTPKHHTQLLN